MLGRTGMQAIAMTDQMIILALFSAIPGSFGALAFGIVAIVRESYNGRTALTRAQKGVSEPGAPQSAVPRFRSLLRRR